MQEEREPSSGRNHCIDGSNLSDLIRTLGARNDGGHGGEDSRASLKLFLEGVSLEEGSVSMDVLVNQSKEKDCEPQVFIEGEEARWQALGSSLKR